MQVDRETVIELALEAGITFSPMTIEGVEYEYRHVHCDDDIGGDEAGCVERFANLIAQRAAEAERERICAAIKAEDDHCATGDYMLDSDDCIKVARGQWQRPDYGLGDAPRPPTARPAPLTPFPSDFAQAYWRDRSGEPDL